MGDVGLGLEDISGLGEVTSLGRRTWRACLKTNSQLKRPLEKKEEDAESGISEILLGEMYKRTLTTTTLLLPPTLLFI